MKRVNTIIKHNAVTEAFRKAETDLPPTRKPARIQAAQVTAAREELEEEVQWRGILRGDAQAAVEPYVMADLTLEPAFPLPAPVQEPVAEEEPEKPEAPTPEALQQINAAWERRLEEAVGHARTEAYEEGYEQGYVAAEAALQGSFDQRRGELEKDVAHLQDAWQTFLKKSEPLMASLAFDIVRQLLNAPLPQDVRAVSAEALSQALDEFGKDIPIDVTLNPDDHARLQAYGLIDDLEAAHSSIRWTPDASIAVGDWIIQSPEAALRRLKEEMLNHLQSRLGLMAVMKSRDVKV